MVCVVSMYMFAAGAIFRLNRSYHVQCYRYPICPLDFLKFLGKVSPSTPPCQRCRMIDSICIVVPCPQDPKNIMPKWVTSYVIFYIAWLLICFVCWVAMVYFWMYWANLYYLLGSCTCGGPVGAGNGIGTDVAAHWF